MPIQENVLEALQAFAQDVTEKMNQVAVGEPEDQLRAPFENLWRALGPLWGRPVVCTGEVLLADRVGKPDYGLHAAGALIGFAELKAPGIRASADRFTGR